MLGQKGIYTSTSVANPLSSDTMLRPAQESAVIETVANALMKHRLNEMVILTINRSGKEEKLKVAFAEQP